MDIGRFSLILVAIVIVMFILTYLLHWYFRHKPKAKYFLPLLALVLCLYNFFMSRTVHNGFQDLAYLVVAMLFGAATLASFLSCLFLDYLLPRWRR